jgi:hypothetical protein
MILIPPDKSRSACRPIGAGTALVCPPILVILIGPDRTLP